MARHVDQCANNKALPFKSEINSIANYCKRKIPAAAKTEVLNSVVNLVVQDLRPISVVDDLGMQKFFQILISIGAKYGCLDAKEFLPSRNTVSNHMKLQTSKKKEVLNKEMQQAFESKGGLAITDMWQDDHKKESYFSCTTHWISASDCCLKQAVLFCAKFAPSVKSAENIRNKMVKCLASCDIDVQTSNTSQSSQIKEPI